MGFIIILGVSIFTILFLCIIGIYFNTHDRGKQEEHAWTITKIFISIFIINCVLGFISFVIQSNSYIEQKPETIEIVALQDSQNVTGRFYFRSGYIEEKLYYYMMYNSDKGQTTLKLQSDKSYITESNDVKPHVEIYRKAIENKFLIWYLGESVRDDYYKIYAPKGTIDKSFSIDLK
jgi:hypothetical protein